MTPDLRKRPPAEKAALRAARREFIAAHPDWTERALANAMKAAGLYSQTSGVSDLCRLIAGHREAIG